MATIVVLLLHVSVNNKNNVHKLTLSSSKCLGWSADLARVESPQIFYFLTTVRDHGGTGAARRPGGRAALRSSLRCYHYRGTTMSGTNRRTPNRDEQVKASTIL